MTDFVLTNAQMRKADEYTVNVCGIPSEELMRRAGEAIAEEVEKAAKSLNTKKITVVCGTGNNGGDGYVCAEILLTRGYEVEVFAFDGNLSPDCLREKQRYSGGYTQSITGGLIVDCIFGTGLCREVSGKYAGIIEIINAIGAFIISADIPSGLNGDNGLIMGVAVRADITVAISEFKAGMFLNDGLDVCGKTVKKYIGIRLPVDKYAEIYSENNISYFFPKRKHNSHKGTYGSACLVAGSEKYAGAAALSTEAALKSGCGYVKLCTAEKVKNSLVAKFPQTIFSEECDLSSQAIAIGMGCGVNEELYSKISHIITTYGGTLIIDADGLNSLAEFGAEILKNKTCNVILTPHIKEFSRLSDLTVNQILQNPLKCAQDFALEYGVLVVLKSSATVITDGVCTAINTRGNSALAKGGSGDMLSGYLCGTVARGIHPYYAAVTSCFVLGGAAEIAAEEKTEYCTVAEDILKNLHFFVKRLTK